MKPTDTRLHQETWGLLPWLANGRAAPAQHHRAEAHLADCADCRAALAREQRLRAAMAQPSVPGPDLSQGLARLMQRLDQATPARPQRPWLALGVGNAGRNTTIRLSTAALLGALQLALFAAAAAWWLHTSAPANDSTSAYQTLTQAPASAAPVGPGVRAVFHGERSIGELQALLVGHALVIVSGPTEAGVFTLGSAATPPTRDVDTLAAELRRSPAVAFAEPVGAATAR
jgi:hypothetical protein